MKYYLNRPFLAMATKLSIYLMIFFMATPIFALDANGQTLKDTKVSISTDKATLLEVFDALERQTPFRFVYNPNLESISKQFTYKRDGITMREALELLSKDARLKFSQINRSISVTIVPPKIKKIVVPIFIEISGTVTDANGEPLPGASVSIKGTTIGATTDFDGKFTLEIPDDAEILVISYLGFQTKEITIGEQTNFNVQLQEDAQALDEIILTGYKKQSVDAIKAKRAEIVIGEFLSQDNIGRLPDFAAADAARRIPGVNTIFQEDEATQVSVRGLAPIFTYSTIDGMFLPSGDRGSRVANFETIPSSAIKTIEVYKSRTADKDGNAIGGVFNLETRSAFDNEGFFANGRFTVGKYDFDEVPRSEQFRNSADKNGLSIRTDVTISQRFGKKKQFGIIVSGSYNRKDRDEFKTPKRNYDFLNDDPNKPVPDRLYFTTYDNLVKRYGGFAKLEFKPNDNFHMSLSGNVFRKTDDEVRLENRFRNLAYDEASVTPTGGNFTEGRVQLAYDHFLIEHKVSNVIFDVDYGVGKSKFDGKIGYTKGYLSQDGPWGGFGLDIDAGLAGSYTIGPNLEDISLNFQNPDFYTNPANWDNFYVGGRGYRDDEDAFVGQLNYAYNMDLAPDETGWGVKTGFSFREIDHVFNRIDMSVNINDNAADINFADFPLQFYNSNAFNNGSIGLVQIDNVAFEDWIATNTNTNGIDDAFDNQYNRAYRYNLGNRFRVQEVVKAFYGMTRYKGENFSLTGGLRFEDTRTDLTRIPEINGNRDENVTSIEKNNYTNLLPSFNATFDVTEKIRLKGAYYQAIGRGNYQQIAPVVSVDDAAQTRNEGNPDLKPRKADNFDVQMEYYFDGSSSLLSFGYFHKSLKDDIRSDEFVAEDGYTVKTNFNGLSLDVSGFELNFIKSDFKGLLPGFLANLGLTSNFTFLNGRREVQKDQFSGSIAALPRTILNSQLYYQKDKFDARIAWNHVGSYVKSAIDDNPGDPINDDQYWKPFDQFDFTTNYQLTDNFSLFFEWRNLTNANRGFTRGRDLLIEDTEFGGSVWLGTTFKF